jgi:hypothetical protein
MRKEGAQFSFGAFVIDAIVGALLASVLMNIACALTHDWGNAIDHEH